MDARDIIFLACFAVVAALACFAAWPSARERIPIVQKMSPAFRKGYFYLCIAVSLGCLGAYLLLSLGRAH